MKDRKNTPAGNRRKLLACLFFSVVSLTVAVVLTVIDPIAIIARMYTRISKDSMVLEFLKGKLDGIHISIYLFNITNPEEFMSGKDQKLKVEEVGPFTYREILYIENMRLDEEASVMRYNPRMEAIFVPEESIGRPEDFNVTMPNMVLLGATSMMSSYPLFVRKAFDVFVRQQKSKAIVAVDAKAFLWGTPDPLLQLAKTMVPGLVNFDKLGFLDQLYNAQTKNEMVVGASESDKFMIKSRNGHKRLMMSSLQDSEMCTKCEIFENAYEGMMYPSPVRPDTPIRIFRAGYCKLLDIVFHKKTVLDNGVEALVFKFNNSFYDNGRIRGLSDVSDCFFGFPAFLSTVYFSDTHPELYDRIDGIKPNPNKFKTYIMIEPITGVGIATYGSAQINLALGDLSLNPETRRFSNMVLPVCYVTMKQPELPELIASVLKLLYVTLPLSLLITRILLFLVSFILLAYCIRLFRSRRCAKNVTSSHIPTKKYDKVNSMNVGEPLISD